jgi:hypothetical protein
VKTSINIPESLCVEVCSMFEKRFFKYVEVNHEGTHTYKIFLDDEVKP